MNLLILTLLTIFSYFGTLDACFSHCRRKREIGDFETIDNDADPEFGITENGDYDCCGVCNRRQDYQDIFEEAVITKEKLHKLFDENLQLFKIPGFTEEGFEQQWSAMAGDSGGAVNKTQLVNYFMKYIQRIGNTVNLRQEENYEDTDADSEKKKSLNLNFILREEELDDE